VRDVLLVGRPSSPENATQEVPSVSFTTENLSSVAVATAGQSVSCDVV